MTPLSVSNPRARLGLGVGIDMPWSMDGQGFRFAPSNGDTLSGDLRCFFDRYRTVFDYAFVAFQPKARNVLRAADYFEAYDSFFASAEGHIPRTRAFHQTILNLGSLEPYDPEPIIEFTNELIARYHFSWVLEDLGIWSIRGKPLPYPLPPFLTAEGLRASIRNVDRYQRGLVAPLYVEFPGFTEGISFTIGRMDAFDYFAQLAAETGCRVTIDIGHIMSYQWLQGRTQRIHYDEFQRLPLNQCFELHLSGCQVIAGKFRDLHNGVLLDEQIDVLEYLLPHCPNLKGVTYEDPKFTRDGELVARSRLNFERLAKIVNLWKSE